MALFLIQLTYFIIKGKIILCWQGPVSSVIGRDDQQILVKHGSNYIRLHSCNLQLMSNNISRFNALSMHFLHT